MLLGRNSETARIDALLAAAATGHAGVLVLHGEPGAGKSSLLAHAESTAAAGNLRVLRARGIELESGLAFAGLADLLRPVTDLLGAIPPPQATALASALALGPASGEPARDRFTICVATLSLLAVAAEEAPLLAIVDDAQWLDEPSAEALVFAARRLASESVAMLLAVRRGEPSPFLRAALPELAVHGLGHADAVTLVRRSAPAATPAVAARLAKATGGNPLALVELPAVLTAAQLAGSEPIAEPIPAGPGIELAFRHRLEQLPDGTRRALLVAAAGEASTLEAVGAALVAIGLELSELDAAEEAGLVDLAGMRVEFRHPLVRSAAYYGAPASQRRAAHRALAGATAGERAGEQRAWHLATAASEPDEAIAAELERTAETARARGGHAAAAAALERAATLTAEPERRARRLLDGADDARLGGQPERANAMLEDALAQTRTADLAAEIDHLRGVVEVSAGRPMAAHALLVRGAERIEATDPGAAARMLVDAIFPCFIAGDSTTGVATAKRALEIGRRAGGEAEQLATALLSAAAILRGEVPNARDLLIQSAPLLDRVDALSRSDQLVHFAGALLVWIEEFDWARALIDASLDKARAASAPGVLPYALAARSALDYRLGAWPSAYASASEAFQLANETGQNSAAAHGLVCVARVEAAQGREEQCRGHLRRARELAGELEAGSVPLFLGAIAGLLELGLGRPAAALAELEQVLRTAERFGLGEPGVAHWSADIVEAAVRAGDDQRARRHLAELERRGRDTGRVWALATAARCRGLLADDDAFEEEFAEALRQHDGLPLPFERARTLLCLGERRRRARRRADAREPLRDALATFERLGAAPWAERARAELGASGETAAPQTASALAELTPQELQVAVLVGRGATNKEAGASLFLSPKTIETHLGRIYRKLDVRSRTELANRLAAEGALERV